MAVKKEKTLEMDAKERLALRQEAARHRERRVLLTLEILFGAALLIGAVGMIAALRSYQAGESGYEQLRAAAQPAAVGKAETGGSEAGAADEEPGVDFSALWEQCPDAVAWLSCPGTEIDYPVVQSADNEYYLRRLPTGEWNMAGSLFVDYRHAADFSGPLTVVYGHNMKNGSMFGTLERYQKQEWYEDHPSMTLETPEGPCVLQVLYGFTIPAQEWVERDFVCGENCAALLEYAQAHTVFDSGAEWEPGAPLAALVTCDSRSDSDRFVLVCGVSREDGDRL